MHSPGREVLDLVKKPGVRTELELPCHLEDLSAITPVSFCHFSNQFSNDSFEVKCVHGFQLRIRSCVRSDAQRYLNENAIFITSVRASSSGCKYLDERLQDVRSDCVIGRLDRSEDSRRPLHTGQ